MKNFTALLLLAIALAVAVDADKPKGAFNLSGSLDPGFSFGRGRSRKHRASVREEEGDNIDNWPSPEEVHNFEVPEEFTHGGPHDADDENDPSHNNEKSHGKGRRHG